MTSLPVLGFGRPVIPGTRHTVRCSVEEAPAGHRVMVVLEESGTRRSVGTICRVEALVPSAAGGVMLSVVGEALATVDGPGDAPDVIVVDEGADVAPELMEAVGRLLRTYMAARAEAGTGGDVHVEVTADPIAASHQVASLLDISGPEIQEILEAGDARERLERCVAVLRRETGLLHAVLGGSA